MFYYIRHAKYDIIQVSSSKAQEENGYNHRELNLRKRYKIVDKITTKQKHYTVKTNTLHHKT